MRHSLVLFFVGIAWVSATSGCDSGEGDGDADVDVDADVDADADADEDTDMDLDGSDGSEDSGPPCDAEAGIAQLTGQIQGHALVASAARANWFQLGETTGYSVTFHQSPGTCDELMANGDDRALILFLCSSVTGEQVIGDDCLSGSGVSFRNSARLILDDQTYEATEGTVTLDGFDPSCGETSEGSLSLQIDGQEVTGSFNTVGCGQTP